jgi:biopolymer transport protein ExbD
VRARRSLLVEGGGGLPVAPLIDCVMLLLIFFMLISRYLAPSLQVTLPEAAAASTTDQPAVSLSIDSEGRLSLDGQMILWDELPDRLQGRDPETLVRIGADRTVDYDYVIKAMDAAAGASLTHIALETEAQPRT